jgi:hypothetical protein
MEWIDEVKLSPTPSPELDEECQNMHIDEEAEKMHDRGTWAKI